MKVAITDYTFPNLDLEEGIISPVADLVHGQCKTADDLIALTRDADAVITQFAPVTREVIQAMGKAKVIVRYGIGVDNVDLDTAAAKGIAVCNVPDYCIDEVADHTLAFILSLTRRLLPNHDALRQGEWKLAVPLESMSALCRLTVGVVGYGRIGQAVCRRLRGFGCRLLVFDPAIDAGRESTSLDQLFAESDILTLHCPSTDQTRGMINHETFQKMKPGAMLINASRGDLVDTAALVEALQRGQLSGAALDVGDQEPIPIDSPLRKMENVVLSAHVASASGPAVTKLRQSAADMAVKALQGEALPNVVNGVAS